MRIFTVIHPTPFCNLDCTYCWAPDRSNTSKISLETLDTTLSQVYGGSALTGMDMLWLTGEPLVMGLQHFRDTVDLCRKRNRLDVQPQFVIQTNGTLIDEAWCEFFAENDFKVGVSVDGPAQIHDHQRRTKAGRPTFEKVERAIDLLTEYKIRGGAICVITSATLDQSPDDLFHFFYDRRITWTYLIESAIGEHEHSTLSSQDHPPTRLPAFISRLLDLWAEYPDSYIRDFDQATRRVFGGSRPAVNDDNLGCLDILNVSADGSFYWGNPELMSAIHGPLSHLKFNLSSDDVWKCRATPAFRHYQDEVHRGVERCREECQFFAGCQGGNPAHKYYEFESFDVAQHTTCQLNDQTIQTLMAEKILSTSEAQVTLSS
ncbi:MAG: radical SAM protein [Candidatus Hydrogenedens sp.]|nr:radical SAM protein [Candidatus Hydrogenedens sp.]